MLGCYLISSLSVQKALTTLTTSLHSKPDMEFFLAEMRDSTLAKLCLVQPIPGGVHFGTSLYDNVNSSRPLTVSQCA